MMGSEAIGLRSICHIFTWDFEYHDLLWLYASFELLGKLFSKFLDRDLTKLLVLDVESSHATFVQRRRDLTGPTPADT